MLVNNYEILHDTIEKGLKNAHYVSKHAFQNIRLYFMMCLTKSMAVLKSQTKCC